MAKNKQSQKTQSRNKTLWIVGVSLGIILCLLGIWYLTRNTTLHIADKEQVEREIASALEDAQFSGEVVYNSNEDAGCDSGNSVGTASYIHCDFLAQKYFRGHGNLAEQIRAADKRLTEAGWRREQTTNEYDSVFSGASRKQLEYNKNGLRMFLVFYRDASWNSYFDIKKLLDEGKIPSMQEGEFVYGAWIYTSYWSCRWDSILKQPCPAPPSKPSYQ